MKFPSLVAPIVWGLITILIPQTQAQNGGTPDPLFGTNGLAPVNAFADEKEAAVCAFPLASGKIIVMGDCEKGVTGRDFALVRLLENGTIDQTFGDNGKKSFSFGSNAASNDDAFDGLVQPDGKFLLLGNAPKSSGLASGQQTLMMRFDENGNLDNTFGTGGKAVFDGNNGKTLAKAVALQKDGKIIVVGEFANDNTGDMLVMRFLSNGRIDNSFGTGGVAHIGSANFKDEANDVLVQPNGQILVVGYFAPSASVTTVAVARFNTNGTPDLNFGNGDGLAVLKIGAGSSMALRLCLQPDGKIGLACHQLVNGQRRHTIARLLPNGKPDDTFGDNGDTLFPFGDSNDFPSGIWAQPDGKLVVAGSAIIGTQHHFVATRFLPDGQPDNTFGTKGKVTRAVGSPALARHAVPLPGKLATNGLLICGNIPIGNNENMGVVKFRMGNVTTSSVELLSLTKLTVSPNPVAQEFRLHYALAAPTTITLDLYDAKGRLVHRFFNQEYRNADEYLESLTMPDHLATGTYTLLLRGNEGQTSVTILKNE